MPRVWPRYGDARARLTANLSPTREGGRSPTSSAGSARGDATQSSPGDNPLVSPASAPIGTPSPESCSDADSRLRRSTGQLSPLGSGGRRGTPTASLPQRDPVTRKRLWPKLGGYEPIKVPASSRFLSSSDSEDDSTILPLRSRTQSPPPRKPAYSPPKAVGFDLEESSLEKAKMQESANRVKADAEKIVTAQEESARRALDAELQSREQEEMGRKEAEQRRLEAKTREEEEDRRHREKMTQADTARREKEREALEREAQDLREREARAKEEAARLKNERARAEEARLESEREARQREAQDRKEREARAAEEEERREREREEAARRQRETEAKERESREALEREKVMNAQLLKKERELFEQEKAKMELERRKLEEKLREKELALQRTELETGAKAREVPPQQTKVEEAPPQQTKVEEAPKTQERKQTREVPPEQTKVEEAPKTQEKKQTGEGPPEETKVEEAPKTQEKKQTREIKSESTESTRTDAKILITGATSAHDVNGKSAALLEWERNRENSIKQRKNDASTSKDKKNVSPFSVVLGVVWMLSGGATGVVSAIGDQGAIIFLCAALGVSMSTCALHCLSPDEVSEMSCGLLIPIRHLHDGYWPVIGHWFVVNTQILATFEPDAMLYFNSLLTAVAMTITSIVCLGAEAPDWSDGPSSMPGWVLSVSQLALLVLAFVHSSPAFKNLPAQDYVLSAISIVLSTGMVGCAVKFLDPESLDASRAGATCQALKLDWIGDEMLLAVGHCLGLLLQMLLSFGFDAEMLLVSMSMVCGQLMTAFAVILLGDEEERRAGGMTMLHVSLASTQLLLVAVGSGGAEIDAKPQKAPRSGGASDIILSFVAGSVGAWMTYEAIGLLA